MGLLPYNFGLEGYFGLALYLAGIAALLISMFWRPIAGLYYLIPLIPLQTSRDRMSGYPLGATVVSIVLLGGAFGILRQRHRIFPKTPWTFLLAVYALFSLATVFLSLENLGPRLKEWWDYMIMPLLFFFVAATVKDVREMKIILVLMCLATFAMDKSFWDAIKDRDYSTFSRDLQEGGSMGYAGVQGMGAFNAQYAWLMVAMAGAGQRRVIRYAYLALGLFAANCVMYSFSRGAYVAIMGGWLFVGLVKHRTLLVLLVLLAISWASLVPAAVQQRVLMTYDPNEQTMDHAAAVRLELWNDAVDLFQANPLLGTGFHTYAYMKRLYNYEDTHNIYLKVLVESGVIGLAVFLWLLGKTFWAGYVLFRKAREPFFGALGLGLAAWIVCTALANLFGDRWTYFQISGYLWVLMGLVARAFMIESGRADAEGSLQGEVAVTQPQVARAV